MERKGGIATPSYEAYGHRPPGVAGAATAYAGQVCENRLEAYLLGRRLYVPALRRFANADPLSPFDAGGWNRYAYCAGDPVNRIDPTGNMWKRLFGRAMDGIPDRPRDVGRAGSMTPSAARHVTRSVEETSARAGGTSLSTLREVWAAGGTKFKLPHRGGTVILHSGPEWRRARRRGTNLGATSLSAGLISREYKPEWLKFTNARGRDVFLPDAVVTPEETFKQIRSYLREQGASNARDVVMLAGGHGRPNGLNWTQAGTWGRKSDVNAERGLRYVSMLTGRTELRGLAIKDVGAMTQDEYRALLDGDRTVFGGICFLAADEVAMQVLNYDTVNTFLMQRL